VTIADLYEAEFAYGILGAHVGQPAQAERFQHASLHYAEGPRTSPGHALQEPTPVNTVVIVVMENLVFLRVICHFFLRVVLSVFCCLSSDWRRRGGERVPTAPPYETHFSHVDSKPSMFIPTAPFFYALRKE
jgi:hypothetical protein